jgi:hypothetical protein
LLENGDRLVDVRYFIAVISHLLSICGKPNISVAAILIAVKGVYNICSIKERMRLKADAVIE